MAEEARLERRLVAAVKARGGVVEKFTPVRAGVPDRIVLWPGGRVEFVELKAARGTLTPVQRLWCDRAAAIGHQVTVVRGDKGLREWLDSTDTNSKP